MPFRLIRYNKPIIEKDPTHEWEAGSVLNPSVIRVGDTYHMFYRATNATGITQHGQYMSAIGHATSIDGIDFVRDPEPFIVATEPYENGRGCEDPRVTYIEGTYYIYYTAVAAGKGTDIIVRLALATSTDLQSITKHGIVGPYGTRSKAGCLLPEKVDDTYLMYFTYMSDGPSSSIVTAQLDTIEEILDPHQKIKEALENYDEHVVLRPDQSRNVYRGAELGAVPVKTESGWLLIYCGTNHTDHPLWTIDAALLDMHDPAKVIARLPEPILTPETPAETSSLVHNVTFPEGAVVINDELYVYYGSGDQGVLLATCKLQDILDKLRAHPAGKPYNED